MIIQIEPQSDIPIYTQLANQIIEGIARGYLQPGQSLPSVREFAADLGVNMHTVNKSYHELEKKGIISIVPKSGAVVCSPNSLEPGSVHYERLFNEFKLVVANSLVLGMDKDQIQELLQQAIHDLKGNKG